MCTFDVYAYYPDRFEQQNDMYVYTVHIIQYLVFSFETTNTNKSSFIV